MEEVSPRWFYFVQKTIDMDIEEFRNYCLSKSLVTESLPFDAKTLVFKVGGKMFALTDIDAFTSINLKCDPDKSIELRELHSNVKPGYHMNKTHWNTVTINHQLSDAFVLELADHSYDLVFASLPKAIKEVNNSGK
jgi:predicted DNA-binding protein (MmcQ/YjbR family)